LKRKHIFLLIAYFAERWSGAKTNTLPKDVGAICAIQAEVRRNNRLEESNVYHKGTMFQLPSYLHHLLRWPLILTTWIIWLR
jgi:hypothetical protein